MARPTYEQLVAALPDPEELGPGFETSDPVPMAREGPASVMRGYASQVTNEGITISLVDAVSGTPQQWEDAALYWTRHHQRADDPDRIDVVELDPPPFGEEGVRRRTIHAADSKKNNGDHIAWRYQGVIASVSLVTPAPGQPDALPYAERLHAKLVSTVHVDETLPEDNTSVEPTVVVRTDCPSSHPIKAAPGPAGEKLYYRPLDCDYEEVIGEACFASEAGAQRAGYRHAAG